MPAALCITGAAMSRPRLPRAVLSSILGMGCGDTGCPSAFSRTMWATGVCS